jgi:hypothetical protein
MIGEWKDYIDGKMICDLGDRYIIKPFEPTQIVPLSCSLCESLYRTRDDELAHHEFGACYPCAMKWAHPNRKRWAEGFRPSKEDIIIDVESRTPLRVIVECDVG